MSLTLREALDREMDRALRERQRRILASATSRTLAAFAMERYRRMSGTARHWNRDPRWLAACSYVINGCRAHTWNPYDFVAAQVDTAGKHCVLHGKAMQPGMLRSTGALARFRRWQQHGLVVCRDRHRDEMLGGANLFGEALVQYPDWSLSQAAAWIRKRMEYPRWTLRELRQHPEARMAALYAAAGRIDWTVPRNLPAPRGAWTWIEQRERLFAIMRQRCQDRVDTVMAEIDARTPAIMLDPQAALSRVRDARHVLRRYASPSAPLPTPRLRDTLAGVRRELGFPRVQR